VQELPSLQVPTPHMDHLMDMLQSHTESENARDGLSQLSRTFTDTTKFGVTVTTSQVMSIDSRTTTLRSTELMISLGDQTASPTHTLRTIPSTTGMTRVMVTSAMDVEVTDADSVEDMDTDTLKPHGDTTDTTSRRDSESVTPTPTSVTSLDQLITNTDTELVVATLKDSPTDMVADMDSDTERDTDVPTDGQCTTDTERVTHPPRVQLWVMVLVLMLLSQRDHTKCEELDRIMAIVQYYRPS